MASQATLSLLIELKDNASKGLDSITSSLGTLGTIAGGVALAGVAAFGAALVSGVGDAREAAKVYAQTEQVIKSTGGAAGFSAQQIKDMAGSLSAASGQSLFGDDDIEKGQNMLLTFTNIKEVLPDTTKTMLDMAQALGTDAGGAAIQLGKALNDPIKGISALTRVGVTFTAEQKKQIKALQEAGDMAGAQRVILAELNKEFGGSALAAAKADGGWAQFTDRLGEAKEALGAAVIPLLNGLASILNDRVMPVIEAGATAFGELISAFQTGASEGGGIIGGLSNALYYLGGVAPIFDTLGDAVVTLGGLFDDAFGAGGGIGVFLDDIRELTGIDLSPVVTAVQGAIAPLIATFTDARTPIDGFLAVLSQISPTFALVQAGVSAAIGPIQDIIFTVFGIISGFITEHGAKIQADLTSAWQQVQAIIQAVIPPIQSIISSVFGAIATFLHAHGAEIQAFLGQTWDAIASIINVALQLIQATIVPVLVAIAGFISAHSTEIQGLLSAAWTIISNVIDAALTIIKGVLTAALQIIKGDWAGAWETIKQMAVDVWENIKAIFGAAVDAIKIELSLAWDVIKGDVLAAWDAIKGAVSAVLSSLVSTIEALPGQVAGVGAAVVNMIWDGIRAKWSELVDWFNGKLQEMRDMLPFSEPRDTSSPLYGLAESGRAIIEMLVSGMQAAGSALPDTMAGLGGDATAALDDTLSSVRSLLDDSDLPGQAASLGSDLMAQLSGTIESGASGVLGTIASVGARIRSALEEMTRGTGGAATGGGGSSAGGIGGVFTPAFGRGLRGMQAVAQAATGGFVGTSTYDTTAAPAPTRAPQSIWEAIANTPQQPILTIAPGAIVIHAAPGTNERQIAEMVVREIDRRMRSKK